MHTFLWFNFMLYYLRMEKVSFKWSRWSCDWKDFTSMSWMYTSIIFPIWYLNILCTSCWYVAPAFLRPNDITIKNYSPRCIMTEVLSRSSGSMLIWLYPKYVSMILNNSCLAVSSMSLSICGNGEKIFGTCFVQVIEVNTHPLFPTLLQNCYYIG